jgi:hypothetical protein
LLLQKNKNKKKKLNPTKPNKIVFNLKQKKSKCYLVVFIEGGVLSSKRLPMSLVLRVVVAVGIRRGTVRFGAFPNILSAITNVLSLSS